MAVAERTKIEMRNRINYFRTMPQQVLSSAANLESGTRALSSETVTHDIKSVLVSGRIMLLNCN